MENNGELENYNEKKMIVKEFFKSLNLTEPIDISDTIIDSINNNILEFVTKIYMNDLKNNYLRNIQNILILLMNNVDEIYKENVKKIFILDFIEITKETYEKNGN